MVETRSSKNRRNRVWWSDLNHDVQLLVMMKLGVIDFVSFSGVCKSWRSFALANRKMFMASRPPMVLMKISSRGWKRKQKKKNEIECSLGDYDGRMSKTVIRHPARPQAAGKWSFVGLARGYLVCCMVKSHIQHLWLVNPITRHQLHFPAFPGSIDLKCTRAVLVFSPSVLGWVLVVTTWGLHKAWFSIAGQRVWTSVSCEHEFLDIHAFKGKIYTLNSGAHLYELRLNPNPSLSIILEFKDFWVQGMDELEFLSLGENLCVFNTDADDRFRIIDFGQMKLVSPEENTIRQYGFFFSCNSLGVAIKLESCPVDIRSVYEEAYNCFLATTDAFRKGLAIHSWYFPHLCLDVDTLDES